VRCCGLLNLMIGRGMNLERAFPINRRERFARTRSGVDESA